MQKKYLLKGLDCPNCAAKIEAGVKALPGVATASCSAINAALNFEVDSAHAEGIFAEIEKIVHQYEPEVEVVAEVSKQQRGGEGEKNGQKQIIQFIIGTAVFIAALIVRNTLDAPFDIYVFLASYLILGGKVIYRAIRNILRRQFFDECFLMTVATGGAFIIGEYPEAVTVMLFYLVGEYLQDMAVRKSVKSITDLMDIRPDFAFVKHNDEWTQVAPETVKIGDIILVKPGEKVPLDGTVLEGESSLDTKALTGEAAPRRVRPGESALSGCINLNGVLTIAVTKTYGESTVSQIIDLVENASNKKAPTEHFITTFSRYYTPAVVGMAVLLAVVPPLFFAGLWADWLYRALVFLVISCPCALVISIPLGFFGGIGAASKRGVLVKGGNYLDALNQLEVAVFDKTGTLTKGVFAVAGIYPTAGFSSEELLEYAAHAEAFSNHPIAQSIIKAYGKEPSKEKITDCQEISGHGVTARFNGREVLAGNGKLMKENNIAFAETGEPGTNVYITIGGKFAGHIAIADEVKPDSAAAIVQLKGLGVKKTVMLTGDSLEIAEQVAREIAIDEIHAELLPQQKVAIVEKLQAEKNRKAKLAFVGDGINDAPVLAMADIGVAMGGLGSDAAIEAADVVLMTDEPTKLADAVKVAKRTRQIVWQNIVFALSVKGVFLVLGALGVANMWEAVFGDMGVSMLATLNALRVMRDK